MIDNVTHKATRVDVRPLTIEGVLRTKRKDRPLLVGYFLGQLLDAAKRLWPEFEPEDRRALSRYEIQQREAEETVAEKWVPRWRRHQEGYDDDGQSLVEYALILALIAVVAIVGLAFLGGAVANALSTLGQSI